MIKKEKNNKISEIQFYNTFEYLWFKHEDVSLTKVFHFYAVKNMDA
jgi:hypothetical protein